VLDIALERQPVPLTDAEVAAAAAVVAVVTAPSAAVAESVKH
jgi:hypothetical protein